MARAGRISVNLEAGTAQFVLDMEKANRSLNEFGHAGVSNVQATSAALRVLEGNVTNNLRAAERFAASIPGVGKALQAAFPVVGSIALLGVLGELVKKAGEVYEAFEKIRNAPSAIASEFGKLNTSLATSNDALRVTNDRLENDIAKLQGKPQNGLKLALDEAKLSADRLADSINKDLAEVQKLLQQQSIGGFKGFFTGTAPTNDIAKQFGGENGFGGFNQRVNTVTADGLEQIRKATDLKSRDAAQTQLNTNLQKAFGDELAYVNAELAKSQALIALVSRNPDAAPLVADQAARVATLQGLRANILGQIDRVSLTSQNTKDVEQKAELDAQRENSRTLAPQADRAAEAIAKLRDEIQGAQAEAAASGNAFAEAIAKGVARSSETVLRLNQELANAKREAERQAVENPRLKPAADALPTQIDKGQALQIASGELQLSILQRVTEDKKKAAEQDAEAGRRYTESLVEQIKAAEELAKREQERQTTIAKTVEKIRAETDLIRYQIDAVGKGRDAERAAQFASIRATGREENQDPSVVQANIAKQQAQNQLNDATRGVGQTASQGFTQFFKDFEDNTKSAGVEVREVLGGAFSSLDNQLTRLITGQKASFADFFRGIAAQLANLALNNAFASIFKSLNLGGTSGGSSGSSSGGGFLGGLFKAIFGGFKAEGGDVSGGTPYIVGERGPELFVPGGRGSIVPNGAGSGGRNITYNVDARGSSNSSETELRMRRGLAEAHRQGARDGAAVSQERRRRVPNSKAFAS